MQRKEIERNLKLRHIFFQGMKPYSPFMSIGMRLLNNLAKGKYSTSDIYWAHAPLSHEDKPDVVIVTDM